MNSQPLDPSPAAFPLPFPTPNLLAGLFGIAPVEPGFYGNDWSETILISTNHGPTLRRTDKILSNLPVTVLALDGGGFTPGVAATLDAIEVGQVEVALARLEKKGPKDGARLLVPQPIAKKFRWTDETHQGRWAVCVVPGNLKSLPGFLKSQESSKKITGGLAPLVLRRLGAGLRLWVGQALIFALPLLVFGWQALILGLAALLIAAILLSLIWGLLPSRGWLRGLVAGAIVASAMAPVLPLVLKMSIYFSPGLFLSFLWMGVVFSGVKHG